MAYTLKFVFHSGSVVRCYPSLFLWIDSVTPTHISRVDNQAQALIKPVSAFEMGVKLPLCPALFLNNLKGNTTIRHDISNMQRERCNPVGLTK